MDKELFDDLIASCQEVLEHKKGNLQLKTTVLEVSDEDMDENLLLWHTIVELPASKKQKLAMYVNELKRA